MFSVDSAGRVHVLREGVYGGLTRKYNHLINRGFIATGTSSRELHKAFRMFAHRRVL